MHGRGLRDVLPQNFREPQSGILVCVSFMALRACASRLHPSEHGPRYLRPGERIQGLFALRELTFVLEKASRKALAGFPRMWVAALMFALQAEQACPSLIA